MTPLEVDKLFDSILTRNENRLESQVLVFFSKLSNEIKEQWIAQGITGAEAAIKRSAELLQTIIAESYVRSGMSGGKFTIAQLNDGEDEKEDLPEEALLALLLFWSKSEAAFAANEITGTTLDIFESLVSDAQSEGLVDADMIKDVVEKLSQRNKNRAGTISSTEAGKGLSKGQHEVGVELQKKYDFQKSWRSQRDLNVSDTHARANSRYAQEPINVNEMFEVGLGRGLYPRDTNLPFVEAVNCRCYTLLKKIKKNFLSI